MVKPILWDSLEPAEQLGLVAAGETSPLAFMAVWFNISQMDALLTNWHHHYFNWAAQRVISGESQNTVINVSPGSTKTEFWSVHLPVYCMVKYDRVRVLNTSYSKDLVNENSERARSLIKSAEFQQFYPFTIGKDKVDDWTISVQNKRAHQLFSRSSGGQITGVRGGYMSKGFSGYVAADDWDKIDDLFSEAKRKKSHMRLINTLRSRRATSRTPFIFIQQRGHVSDGTAFLLEGKMGLKVDTHLVIPALIDEDYIEELPPGIKERCIKSICHTEQIDGYWSYWPEKENVKDLISLREAHPYTFLSQYQQSPETLEGSIFDEEDFVYYGDTDEGADIETPPVIEYRFITVDTAQKTKERNDWTVFAEWGYANGQLLRMNYKRDRMDAKTLRREFKTFAKACWEKNSGANGILRAILVEDKSSGTGLIQEMSGQLPIEITPVPRARDKLTRAMDVQPHHASKKVALPYGDPQNFELVSEVASFSPDDTHKFDDQTDVMIDALDFAYIEPSRGGGKKAGVLW